MDNNITDNQPQEVPATFPPTNRELSPTKTVVSGSGSPSTRRHTPQSAGNGKDGRDLKAMEDGTFSAPDQAQSILRW